jgi:dipeptidyl aminopeptidase/acylaminoacyl peptidase
MAGINGIHADWPQSSQAEDPYMRWLYRLDKASVLLTFASSLLLLVPAGSLAELPPAIPREVIFGNPQKQSPSVSPDGTRLAYLAPEKGVLNVWVRTIGKQDDAPVTRESHRPILFYRFAEDAEHILYLQDSDGDENWHVYSTDLRTKMIRDLTPFQGVKAQNVVTSAKRPDEILVGLNLRTPQVADMYRINLKTGAVVLDCENSGDVLSWVTDPNFVIRAATAFNLNTGETTLRVRDGQSRPWRNLVVWPFEQMGMYGQINGGTVVADFAPDGKSLYVVSALNSATQRLVRIDSQTGKEVEVLAEHPQSDVAEDLFSYPDLRPLVMTSPSTHAVQAVAFEYLKYEWQVLDPAVKADFDVLQKEHSSSFMDVVSRDQADLKWVVAEIRSDGPVRFYLYDRTSKQAEFLFTPREEFDKYKLTPAKPVVIPARDGVKLASYLTLPTGVENRNLPLILYPHGGPWARDDWGFDPFTQWLTNRGYAVLQVNFRGSTGFGKGFLNAGNHQIGLEMEDDMIDAARWTISQGIADAKRIAILGASAGGYATLRGVSRYPDLFRCGVDLFGPSDLKMLFSSMPAGWGAVKTRWVRRMGDVEHDEKLNHMLSPLYHVDQIRVPLLIGQGTNDPRVNIKNSDVIVEALRKKNIPVTYIVYSDEGHGFARPENNLDFFGRVEEFLAKYLNGRTEPWVKVPGSTAEIR